MAVDKLKTRQTEAGAVDSNLQVVVTDPASSSVTVRAGYAIFASNGTYTRAELSSDTTVGPFDTVSAGNVRWDTVVFTSSGTLAISKGSVVATGSAEFTGIVPFPTSGYATSNIPLAFVLVTEQVSVVVAASDITDARSVLRAFTNAYAGSSGGKAYQLLDQTDVLHVQGNTAHWTASNPNYTGVHLDELASRQKSSEATITSHTSTLSTHTTQIATALAKTDKSEQYILFTDTYGDNITTGSGVNPFGDVEHDQDFTGAESGFTEAYKVRRFTKLSSDESGGSVELDSVIASASSADANGDNGSFFALDEGTYRFRVRALYAVDSTVSIPYTSELMVIVGIDQSEDGGFFSRFNTDYSYVEETPALRVFRGVRSRGVSNGASDSQADCIIDEVTGVFTANVADTPLRIVHWLKCTTGTLSGSFYLGPINDTLVPTASTKYGITSDLEVVTATFELWKRVTV